MTDQRDRPEPEDEGEGNAEFSAEFARLAREERGLAQDRADPGTDRHDAEEAGDEERQDRDERQAPPAEDPAAEEGPAGEADDDIWKDADPKLKAAFDAEQARASRFEGIARSQDGRLSAAARELNQLRRAATTAQEKPGTATPEGKEAEDDEERMAQLREEFPELAPPILDRIMKLERVVKTLEGHATAVDTERNAAFFDHQERLLDQAHSDWRDRVSGSAFVDWAKNKPRHIREAIIRNASNIVDAEEVSDILARYKSETEKPETPEAKALREKRERQLEGGRAPRTRTPTGGGGDGGTSFSSEWRRLRDEEKRVEARNRK